MAVKYFWKTSGLIEEHMTEFLYIFMERLKKKSKLGHIPDSNEHI